MGTIPDYPPARTPLVGDEPVPVWQDGVQKQVTTASLNAPAVAKAQLDYRKVPAFSDLDAIGASERVDGTVVFVVADGREFVWSSIAGGGAGAWIGRNTDAELLNRANHTGTQSADTLVDGASQVAMAAAERAKLGGIEAGAQVNAVDSVNGQTGAVELTKADVGLGNVDNTSDADKPISTAQQAAIDAVRAENFDELFESVEDGVFAAPVLEVLDPDNRQVAILTGLEARADVFETVEDDVLSSSSTAILLDPDNRELIARNDVQAQLDVYEGVEDGVLTPDRVAVLLDGDDREVVGSASPEVLASTVARIDKRSDINGMPRFEPIYSPHRMRRTNMRVRQRKAGRAVQHLSLWDGDSYLETNSYWFQRFVTLLTDTYGRAGQGFAAFGTDDQVDRSLFRNKTGTWTTLDGSNAGTLPASLDLLRMVSSTVGSRITFQTFSQGLAVTRGFLFWNGTSDGVIQYRTNGGTWTQLNVQGTGFQSAALVNLPGTAAWTMDFEVVSGTVNLEQAVLLNATPGFAVFKAGNAGSRTDHRANVTIRAQRQAALAGLNAAIGGDGLDAYHLVFATNDKATVNSVPPLSDADYLTNIVQLITDIRTAMPSVGGVPGPDICIWMPQNLSVRPTIDNSDYLRAVLNVADQYDCTVVNMIDVFGPDRTKYSALFDTENQSLHPGAADRDNAKAGGMLWVDIAAKLHGF